MINFKILILMITLLFLTGCIYEEPLVTSCTSAEFDSNPDFSLMAPSWEELSNFEATPTERYGTLKLVSTQTGEKYDYPLLVTLEFFTLTGVEFDLEKEGRAVKVIGKLSEDEKRLQGKRVFEVESYEIVPYTVLTGKLKKGKYCSSVPGTFGSSGDCSGILLFEVNTEGYEGTLPLLNSDGLVGGYGAGMESSLISKREAMPFPLETLKGKIGKEITLAGILTNERKNKFKEFPQFEVRNFCG